MAWKLKREVENLDRDGKPVREFARSAKRRRTDSSPPRAPSEGSKREALVGTAFVLNPDLVSAIAANVYFIYPMVVLQINADLSLSTVGGGQPRSEDAARSEDRSLRWAAEEARARLLAQLRKPLSQDEEDVLRSTEVLIWSYVAPMEELSLRVLRETAEDPTPKLDSFDDDNSSPVTTAFMALARTGIIKKRVVDASTPLFLSSRRSVAPTSEDVPSKDGEAKSTKVLPPWNERPPASVAATSNSTSIRNQGGVLATAEGTGERGRPSRERKATVFLDPTETDRADRAATSERLTRSQKVDGELGTGGAALTFKDGLVNNGYYDLVPRHLAAGLHIECGRVARRVEWGGGLGRPCRVVTSPLPHAGKTAQRHRRQFKRHEGGSGVKGPASLDGKHESQVINEGGPEDESGDESEDSEGSDEEGERVDECDFVVVALPLGVLKNRHCDSSVTFIPELPLRKREAFDRIGFGSENKVILRFSSCFWEHKVPYLQTTDPRFRILNGLAFGKGLTLVMHCSPPFGNGYGGLDNDGVVGEAVACLRSMYEPEIRVPDPVFSHVTRWHEDPFSMGAYSYWATGMQLQNVLDAAKPEPDVRSTYNCAERGSSSGFTEDATGGVNGASGLLRAPRLFFCGEHATIRDAQCVHGACNSGERAARQVACAALGFLADLDACVTAGETFWYAPPPPFSSPTVSPAQPSSPPSLGNAESTETSVDAGSAEGEFEPSVSPADVSLSREERSAKRYAQRAAFFNPSENDSDEEADEQWEKRWTGDEATLEDVSGDDASSHQEGQGSLWPAHFFDGPGHSAAVARGAVTGRDILLDSRFSPYPTREQVCRLECKRFEMCQSF